MKLLICTQKVDRADPILGFFHRWIEEFAKHCEKVSVICLEEGEHALPANVQVFSLGKEKGTVSRVRLAFRFWRHMTALRRQYDAVFVHMNPEYMVLGGIYWKISGVRAALWYVHKRVDTKLRWATALAWRILTASKTSFRLVSRKVRIIGHGVDVESLSLPRKPRDARLRILTAGRVSATKRIREMLESLDVLDRRGVHFTFTIAGAPATKDDEQYAKKIAEIIAAHSWSGAVRMIGPVPNSEMPRLLSESDVFLNLSATGSMDKAVLEALAAGTPVVTSNEGCVAVVPAELFVKNVDSEKIADALVRAAEFPIDAYATRVRQDYSLSGLISRIMGEYKK